jgi:hypothetical protein
MWHLQFPSRNVKKLYFLHIPKTAGTSISQTLHQIAQVKKQELVGPILLDHLASIPNWKESNFLAGHLGLLPLDYNFQYFTVLRDPLERLYSYYSHVKRDTHHYLHKVILEENLNFLDYLLDKRFYNLNFNMQTRYLSKTPEIGLRRQSEIVVPETYEFENSDVSDISLMRAIHTLEKALWVGGVNNLGQLGQFLEKRYSVSKFEFPHLNLGTENRPKFSSLEIQAAEPLIELDSIIYKRWTKNNGH